MFGLTLFAFLPVFFLLGPAVTALLGYAWQPRRGSGYVLWTGIVCMVWHMAFFAFMLAIQSWLPRALELFPGLAKYFHG